MLSSTGGFPGQESIWAEKNADSSRASTILSWRSDADEGVALQLLIHLTSPPCLLQAGDEGAAPLSGVHESLQPRGGLAATPVCMVLYIAAYPAASDAALPEAEVRALSLSHVLHQTKQYKNCD